MSIDVAIGGFVQIPNSEPPVEEVPDFVPLPPATSPRFPQGQRVSHVGATEIAFSNRMLWRATAAAISLFCVFVLLVTKNQLFLIGMAGGLLIAMFLPGTRIDESPSVDPHHAIERTDEIYQRILENAEPVPFGSNHVL